ncbi:hypothetical protein H6F96_11995 [Microcoleus sp. FACHB-53]|nr:hypothetical protein [Microcoleus sp. FACHB-53]
MITFLYRGCDRVYLCQSAIAFMCRWMRSCLSCPKCDRLYVSVDAIASIFAKVRSCFCVGGCDLVYLSQGAIAFGVSWM